MNTLDSSWKSALSQYKGTTYLDSVLRNVEALYAHGDTIYPPQDQVFTALNLCPFENVSVVILGQDPYHGDGQAHGLAFSVERDVKVPPSLQNIFKEIMHDFGSPVPTHGNLTDWAMQGVLLLNTVLTVEDGKPGSHQKLFWEEFTDTLIGAISDKKDHVVFLFWGKHAQAKEVLIDSTKHLILKAPHPSPFSAHTGFFGSRHFSQTNTYLTEHGKKAIAW